ncbi:MAG TPA: class 1 fructose-bisphosphatase [Candidatus Woesebacteria bacterium]|nr:class 1 fructose-bisphosphatase [Candidatus Woesebacteria bacterium]
MRLESPRFNGENHSLPINITDHLRREQLRHPEATGALTSILADLSRVAKEISYLVNTAGISGAYGSTGKINVQGETVIKLDDQANEQFKNILSKNFFVAGFASEEEESFVPFEPDPRRKYILWFDPLDGSSNFDTNVSIGSIFSIYHRLTDLDTPVNQSDFLQTGRAQVCSGYFLYGSSTMLVYTTGHGVYGFTLDPSVGEFVLPQNYAKITMPESASIYSINEAYRPQWPAQVVAFIDYLKTRSEQPCGARYVGSLVADFHRNLLKGGIFLYPQDEKHPHGKLRLNCELNPLAFLAEQAGGMATDGKTNILDIQPTSLHQRSPVLIGSKNEVLDYLQRFSS